MISSENAATKEQKPESKEITGIGKKLGTALKEHYNKNQTGNMKRYYGVKKKKILQCMLLSLGLATVMQSSLSKRNSRQDPLRRQASAHMG